MRVLVVYETVFGDARAVAHAVAEGLGGEGDEIRVVDVRDGEPSAVDGDLLVLGCPTHMMSMPTPASRRQAWAQYKGPKPAERGMREWIGELPPSSSGRVAVFDTRMRKPSMLRWGDRAGKTASRMLRLRGLRLMGKPQAFLVQSATGPLVDGELDRAREWGRGLAATVARRS